MLNLVCEKAGLKWAAHLPADRQNYPVPPRAGSRAKVAGYGPGLGFVRYGCDRFYI